MNILYLCTYYHRAMIFRDSMNALEQRGHSVMAFNAADKGEKIDSKYRGIMDEKVIHKECFYAFEKYFYPVQQKKFFRAVLNNIKVEKYDIVHSHMLFSGGLAALYLNKYSGVPYVVTIRNTDVNSYMRFWLFRLIARYIVKKANGVLFLSKAYENAFFEKCYHSGYESIKEKCAVVPNGLEPFWLENINYNKGKPSEIVRLICVGKIDRNKNMITAAKAAELLTLDGIQTQLTIIGQVLDKDIEKELSLYDNVLLVNYLNKEELIKFYRNSDIFVMPSFHESFGRVYAEAMTQGLPVIYTRNEGFDGIFAEGEVGYSVDPYNPHDIADAVKRICSNYTDISTNCNRLCVEFDWNKIAEKLETFYLKALDRGMNRK